MTGVRLHVRAEYGELRVHPGYDLNRLADLIQAWRAASSANTTLKDLLDAEAALLEYLRLDLDAAAAHALVQELDDAGVKAVPF